MMRIKRTILAVMAGLFLLGLSEGTAWAGPARSLIFGIGFDTPSNVTKILEQNKAQAEKLELIQQRMQAHLKKAQAISARNARAEKDMQGFTRAREEAAQRRLEKIMQRIELRKRHLARLNSKRIDVQRLVAQKQEQAQRRLQRAKSRQRISARRSIGFISPRRMPVRSIEPRKVAVRNIDPSDVTVRAASVRAVELRKPQLHDVEIRERPPRRIEVWGL